MWIKMLDIPPAKWTKEIIFVILLWDIKPTSTPSRGNYKERKMNTQRPQNALIYLLPSWIGMFFLK